MFGFGKFGEIIFGGFIPPPVAPPPPSPPDDSGGFYRRKKIEFQRRIYGSADGIFSALDGAAVGRVVAAISAEARGTVSAITLTARAEATPYDFTEQGQQDLAAVLLSL